MIPKAETVIHHVLSTNAPVTALIGGTGTAARVYPLAMPAKTVMPAVIYRRIASNRIQGVYSDPGVARVTIQVTAYAETMPALADLAEKIRVALERYGSAVTGTTIDGVLVYDITIGSEASTYEPELGDRDLFAWAIDFTVTHAE